MSTNYSYLNINNRQPIFSSSSSYYPDMRMLPFLAVNNTPIFTFFLIGVTAVTLGYITFAENNLTEGQSGGGDGHKMIGGNKKNKMNISKKIKKKNK
jgi:hypothetical protein